MQKIITGMFIALIFLLIFVVIGQYAGGYVFIKSAKLPESMWSIATLFRYQQSEFAHHIDVAKQLKIGFAIAAAVPLIPFLTIGAAILFGRKGRELHGSGRFAFVGEIAKAGLLMRKNESQQPNILIGKYKNQYLHFAGNEFAFIAAPTRSGKGVGIVIPNLLHYSDSIVVFDPKLENYIKTSHHRQNALKQAVYLFNPAGRLEEEISAEQALHSHRWNPFTYINRDKRFTYSDVMNMAQILYPKPERDSGNALFFIESAQKLFVGLALYMIETERMRLKKDESAVSSLSLLFRMTSPTGYSLADWVKYFVLGMPEFQGEGIPPKIRPPADVSDACQTLLSGFATGNAKTGSDILATLTAPLTIFLDPIVAAATSADDFDLREVRKHKMTIYIGIQPNDIERFGRLTSLLFNQLINENIKQGLPENNPQLKYQCLLLIDEFTSLGYMPILEKGVAFIAGYNLRLLIIFQSPAQVARLYSKEGARTFFSNFAAQIIFPPRDQADANEYSELIGYETFKAKSLGKSSGKGTSRSQNVSDQKRAVMLPDELKAMPQDECIISMRGIRPIHGKKIFYYKEKKFTGLYDKTPATIPELSLENHKPLSNKEVEQVDYIKDRVLNKADILNILVNDLMDDIPDEREEYTEALKEGLSNALPETIVDIIDYMHKA